MDAKSCSGESEERSSQRELRPCFLRFIYQEEYMDVFALSARRAEEARHVLEMLNVKGAWQSVGAEVRLVGSLRTGLILNKRDIDRPDMAESLAAMTPIVSRDGVEKMECRNLLQTEEACLEWHVWYRDAAGELWQLDIIHIRKGSRYDGFVEDFADRLQAALTEETRAAILYLKAQTPEHEQTAGIFYYLAVLRDGIRTYEEFCRWRRNVPSESIVTWRP